MDNSDFPTRPCGCPVGLYGPCDHDIAEWRKRGPSEGPFARIRELQDQVTKLEKENATLRSSLIKDPNQLHEISAGVEEWGFGKRREVKPSHVPPAVQNLLNENYHEWCKKNPPVNDNGNKIESSLTWEIPGIVPVTHYTVYDGKSVRVVQEDKSKCSHNYRPGLSHLVCDKCGHVHKDTL